jgi:hypothetical protein
MTTTQHNLDASAILKRERALAVRNALLAFLRAWEEYEDLPRSIPTLRERGRKDGALPKRDET